VRPGRHQLRTNPADRGAGTGTILPPEELAAWRKRARSRQRHATQLPRVFLLVVAVTLVIWLAVLLSAALTSVGLSFPNLTATNADAATLNCSTVTCATSASTDNTFTSPANSWAVVAVRSTLAAGDPRVCLYTDGTYTTQRACSNASSLASFVEFVAVDGHHSAAVTAFERTDHVSGGGEICTALDCGGTTLVPGAAPTVQSWGSGDVARIYNVPVVAGGTYRADLVETSGTTDFGLALFDSHGQAEYAAGRASAVVSADRRGTGQGEGIYFTASATDTLGLVLWGNNAGATANFRIEVRTATKLVSNAFQSYPGESQRDFFAVPSAPRGWAMLALRPVTGIASTDADLRQYDAPDYLDLVGKSSAEPGVVDFVITNYANTPEDTSAVLMISLGPIGPYVIDWTEQPKVLGENVNDTLNLGGRVGEGRSVNLAAGVQYQFLFDPANGTQGDVALGLYGPKVTKPAFTYGTRIDSLAGSDVFGTSATGWTAGDGIETFLFTPSISGNYLLYAYEKTNLSVLGDLRYFPTTLLGVGDGPGTGVAGLALSAAWPSPARSGETMRFRCTLPVAARVRLSIVDVRGRTVAAPFAGALPAGVSELAWDGRADDGARVSPGMYFARLAGSSGAAAVRQVVWLR
jgi:hypothetical protein